MRNECNPVRPIPKKSREVKGEGGVCGFEDELASGDVEEEMEEDIVKTRKKYFDGKLPTQKEIEEHEIDHLPFRKWCKVCIASRGVDDPHVAREVPDNCQEVHLDYCFFA